MRKNLEQRGQGRSLSAFDSLFNDDFLSFDNWPTLTRNTAPEIRESDKGYALSANLAGIPKEDIHVTVNGNRLTIRAEHNEESGENEGAYSSQYRSYHQSFTLPSDVDADQIEAHCDHGRLDIFLPKTGAANHKKVEVQSGKKGFLSRMFGKKDKTGEKNH